MVTVVCRGEIVLGVVLHLFYKDNTGEFDPYYIERIKNCLLLMMDKDFISIMEEELKENQIMAVQDKILQQKQMNQQKKKVGHR